MRVTPANMHALLCRGFLALALGALCTSSLPASAQQTDPSAPASPPAFNNVPPITAAPPPPATSDRPPPPPAVAAPAPAPAQPAPPPAAPAPKETAKQPPKNPPANPPKAAPKNPPRNEPKNPAQKPALTAREESALLQTPCRNELARHCRTVHFGNGRTVACLKQHEAALSRACKAAVAKAAERL
ncbi:MAG: cysteine rich repeat-containing protein [Pseudolabrys sp.]